MTSASSASRQATAGDTAFASPSGRDAELVASGHVDQDDLGIRDRGDAQMRLVLDRGAVALGKRDAVDLDRAAGGDQIAETAFGQPIFRGLSGPERRSQNPRVGPDRQGALVPLE